MSLANSIHFELSQLPPSRQSSNPDSKTSRDSDEVISEVEIGPSSLGNTESCSRGTALPTPSPTPNESVNPFTTPINASHIGSTNTSSVAVNSDPAPIDSAPVVSVAEPPAETSSPTGQQRVFSVAPLTVMGQTRKVIITILIIAGNLVQMISNIIGISGGLELSKALGVSASPSTANWIAASYPLTQGTFVLMSGRLGAVYGHKNMLLLGGAIFTIFTLVNGFCTTFMSFNIARALTGIGGALIMPNAVAMIGIALPPGRFRNFCLGLFAASAPLGGWLGILILGVVLEVSKWQVLFWFLAVLGVLVFGTLWACLPPEIPVDRNGKIDWIGAVLGTSGLIIFNFVWNQAPSVGWAEPYEYSLLIVSVLLMAVFVLWEHKYAAEPIMPLDIFRAPSFAAVVLVVLLSYMSFGTLLWYQVAFQQLVRKWSVLSLALGWTPFAIFAVAAAGLAAWMIPRLAAQWILAIGAGSVLVSNLLLATMPAYQTYWKQMFVTTVLMSFCPDFVYTAAQIIASNSVRRRQQGIAGSLIGTLNLYGNSLGLGFAGTVETQVGRGGTEPVKGYRAALFFGVGIAAAALLFDLAFVRMARDEREGWEDEGDVDPADEVIEASGVAAGLAAGRGLQTVVSRTS